MSTHLMPPRQDCFNAEYTVPLTPHTRPPFSHYQSSSTLPNTPHTPFPLPASPSKMATSTTRLQPHLGLPARILLTTLSPALLPLILTIAHLIHNRSSTASLAASLRASLLSACSGLATGAASLLTMPRYLAMQTNEQAVRATQASILAIGAALGDCVSIIEAVVLFIVETYRSMLMCTIELVVRGTLEVVIGAVQNVSEGITNSLNSIRMGIQNDIAGANRVIQAAVDRINSLTNRININIDVPEFSIPALSGLENVAIPTGFEDSLIRLNTTLPTLNELKDKLNDIIEIPFNKLKAEINETRIEMAASFNSTILPVPLLSQLSASKANQLNTELCSDIDTSLIDDTANALHKLSNVAIGLMFLVLFLVWAAMCLWEWRRWRALKDMVETIEEEWQREGKNDAWRAVAIVENPVLEKYGSPILRRLAPDQRRRTNMRWYLSYLAHPTCLALLFIALLGFLSIQFQLLALNAIKNHARENANATVAQSSNDLTAKLNDMALASSQQYATDFNLAIDRYEDRINNELFGNWLNTTAITLNSTLEEFYNGIEDALNTTFGGTILYNPVNTFMYCILGSKIDTLQKGLTWMSEHAQVDLPRLPPDVLLLSSSSMNEIAQPISAAAVGSSTEDGDEGAVGSLIKHFEKALEVERTFYAILLGVWLAFALIGIIIVIWNSGVADRYDAWRASRGAHGAAPTGAGARSWPWKKEHPIYDQHTEEERQFRGTSPSPAVPRIAEPQANEKSSFFDYNDAVPSRPFVSRNGTFGSTISSLAAPGQAFLKLTGRGKSETDQSRLTDGNTSEKYNSFVGPTKEEMRREYDDTLEPPPPFWVNKFYRAVDSAKSILPTRGQRHGAALSRNDSSMTERSFEAGQAQTSGSYDRAQLQERNDNEQWTMANPSSISRALDGTADVSRYPVHPTSSYPRRLSRAPTLGRGAVISHDSRDIFDDPPALPSKRGSIDYLRDEPPRVSDYDYEYEHTHGRDMDGGILSPASSTASYVQGEAHVESANRVQTGTAALAAILANMDGKRREGGGGGKVDPFAGSRVVYDRENRF